MARIVVSGRLPAQIDPLQPGVAHADPEHIAIAGEGADRITLQGRRDGCWRRYKMTAIKTDQAAFCGKPMKPQVIADDAVGGILQQPVAGTELARGQQRIAGQHKEHQRKPAWCPPDFPGARSHLASQCLPVQCPQINGSDG